MDEGVFHLASSDSNICWSNEGVLKRCLIHVAKGDQKATSNGCHFNLLHPSDPGGHFRTDVASSSLTLTLTLTPPAFAGLLQVKEPGRPRREEERPQGKAGKGVSSLPPFMGSAETHLY